MSISTGDIILASDYNNIAHNIHEYWGDNYPTNTPLSSKEQNERGWGQQHATLKSPTNIITADSANELINRSNLAVLHTGTGSNLVKVIAGEIVKASKFNGILNHSGTMVPNAGTSIDTTITSNGHDGTSSKASWVNAISVTMTATFASYAEARYFFNSGGQLRYSLANNGTTNDAVVWQDLFDSSDMGTFIFSKNDIAQTGTRYGVIRSGSGFYELTTVPTKWYSINLDISPYTSNDLYVMCSRSADGKSVIITYVLNNDDSNAERVNGTTTVYLDTRKANDKSSSDPIVNFSINPPVTHTASAWSGS